MPLTCVEIKFYGAFALNLRVNLHAIDATPARWRGDAGSSPLDRARTAASSPAPDALVDFHTVDDRGAVGEDVPRAVDERQRRQRDEVRAGAFGECVDGEPSHSEAVHF